jgi:kinesin family protein 2/24
LKFFNQIISECFRLFVREDGEHHVNIVGLTEIVLKNLDTLRSIIYDGLARRHHGKSAFNSNSSRSHAIFQIIFKNTSNQNDYFRLVFIDLAGSERAIDAQNNQKQTRREGAQINSSLLALKECIRSMDMIHTHAPFRQSKLTHILRDSLVGSKTRTCLMANVSPANDCCQCSLNTLQYASRIRDISIRHRHRSMPISNIQKNYSDNEQQEVIGTIVRENPQRTFKPATASTPVHRLMTSVDHRTYMATNQTG